LHTKALHTTESNRLQNSVILAWATPRIAFGIMGTLFGVYLMKFATDVLMIAPAVMGTILALSRLWDGVTDPLIGYLSDRTLSRFGRRRIWMFAAAVPMSITLVGIWSPPESLSALNLVVWMSVCLLLYETASTAFFIPHGALGLELSPHYHERTRLFGYSHMIGIFGVAAGLAALEFISQAEDKRESAYQLSMLAGCAISVMVLCTTYFLPEKAEFQGRGTINPIQSFKGVFKNPHARLLFIIYGIETFGGATLGILAAYSAEYVVKMNSLVMILVVYQLPTFIFAPLWIRLSRVYGKRNLWVVATLLSATFFGALVFAGEHDDLYVYICCFMAGLGGGAGAVLAPSIQADIIDYDEFTTGNRNEGAYLAVWNLIRKISGSITAFIVGLSLQYAGFEPNVEQTDTAKATIQALLSLMPAVCYIIGALLLFRFTFNEKEHRLVRAQLDRRSPDLAQTPTGKIDHQAPDYSTGQAPDAITDET
jgi:GPH family glycoside/pentoside/hexuronide:cation symporter